MGHNFSFGRTVSPAMFACPTFTRELSMHCAPRRKRNSVERIITTYIDVSSGVLFDTNYIQISEIVKIYYVKQ